MRSPFVERVGVVSLFTAPVMGRAVLVDSDVGQRGVNRRIFG